MKAQKRRRETCNRKFDLAKGKEIWARKKFQEIARSLVSCPFFWGYSHWTCCWSDRADSSINAPDDGRRAPSGRPKTSANKCISVASKPNKFPRDADRETETEEEENVEKCSQTDSNSIGILLPTAVDKKGAQTVKKTWSTTKANKCTACRSSVRQFLVNCFTRSFVFGFWLGIYPSIYIYI